MGTVEGKTTAKLTLNCTQRIRELEAAVWDTFLTPATAAIVPPMEEAGRTYSEKLKEEPGKKTRIAAPADLRGPRDGTKDRVGGDSAASQLHPGARGSDEVRPRIETASTMQKVAEHARVCRLKKNYRTKEKKFTHRLTLKVEGRIELDIAGAQRTIAERSTQNGDQKSEACGAPERIGPHRSYGKETRTTRLVKSKDTTKRKKKR